MGQAIHIYPKEEQWSAQERHFVNVAQWGSLCVTVALYQIYSVDR